ncbi:MAG TPA: hypothetical protein PK453_25300 [Leptospiraceae bacterium]|nr:hypothetical protein [Leptospiraceae bacterium]HMY65637.1 hypothetical protein [Leptospiraceae bacterium]HNF16997.1 hypothetical protein [Leptospiraceae bacterium]HNH07679.1 hypothetical protein [Leptospiraceae bacterium]HNI95730.1 hypothetical protein [Leptospiraceae bacterium]
MDELIDNIEEKITLALQSVPREMAQDVIENKIQDAYAIKVLVELENKNGILIAVFSSVNMKMLSMHSAAGFSSHLKKVWTFNPWKEFAGDFVTALKAGGIENGLSDRVGRSVYRALTVQNVSALVPNLDLGQKDGIISMITAELVKEMKISKISIQLDFEKVNSVGYRTENPINGLWNEVRNPFEEQVQEAKPVQEKKKSSGYEFIDAIRERYDSIARCSSVISPLAGMEFKDLKPGQPILVQCPFKTTDEKIMARRLGAVNDKGINSPIQAKFIDLVHTEKEYHILAEGPNKILIHIIEERPVRIAVPKEFRTSKYRAFEKEDTSTANSLKIILIVLTVVVIGLCVFYFI